VNLIRGGGDIQERSGDLEYIIGTDIGGTGTDCVVVDQDGEVTLGKAFSTPSEFSRGVLDAVGVAADEIGIKPAELLANTKLFLHATTVAENAIVDGDLIRGGLLMTTGFEDTLFMQRGAYGRWSGLTETEKKNPIETDKPPALIPRTRVQGVRERSDFQGKVLIKIDEKQVERAVRELVSSGAEAIGVCFLWAPVNPQNEKIAGAVIRKIYPDLFLSLSNEISPTIGEYERASTVALNIGLGKKVPTYLEHMSKILEENGFRGRLLMMQAHGGLAGIAEISNRPVSIIECGPVSGLIGSRSLGEQLGYKNIIAADMGGTTFKAGVIREGAIEYQREPTVLRYHYSLPKMDVNSIGLAGGSIISIDPQTKRPTVGPKSAGAYPGPVCYGFGGTEPTITDVDIILGYLNPAFFLGGRASLDEKGARTAFQKKVAEPLGADLIPAAGAIYKLANNILYDLIHKMTVERGMDPRGYSLFSYGGTAGMHVGAFGDMLHVKSIVIPHSASVHGAYGLVNADIVHEYHRNSPMKMPVSAEVVNRIFKDLEKKAIKDLTSDGFKESDMLFYRSVDMRYSRQVHIITTPVPKKNELQESDLEGIGQAFEDLYKKKYGEGSGYREAGMYMITFRLRAVGVLKKPKVKSSQTSSTNLDSALVQRRSAFFHNTGVVKDTPCYDFTKLNPGHSVEGPSIIWTPITTVVVNPGQKALCDEYRNLILTRVTEAEAKKLVR
jgi:N-methylhydantoinase A